MTATLFAPTILEDLDRIEEITDTIEIPPLPEHFNSLRHKTPLYDLKSLVALIELTRDCDTSVPLTFLEVGSWAGISALAAASRPNVEVHCVDHWEGSIGTECDFHLDDGTMDALGNSFAITMQSIVNESQPSAFWREAIADCEDPEGVFGVFKKNTEGYDITPHRGNSLEVAKNGIGRQVDVLWIDGDHRYPEVLFDLKAWFPHVRPGGIFCGHDYNTIGVNRAVKEFGFDAAIWGTVWYKRVRHSPVATAVFE